jgi:hypothetical protein
MLLYIDLFCGAGGTSTGVESAVIKGNYKHGKARTPIYNNWMSMKQRCLNINCNKYKDYGGRGIQIYPDWINSFESFYNYISTLPNFNENNIGINKFLLGRINNDGNYEPGNLIFATTGILQHNKRLHKNNNTGYKGIIIPKAKKGIRYRVRLTDRNRRIYLGTFYTLTEAINARNQYIIFFGIEGYNLL